MQTTATFSSAPQALPSAPYVAVLGMLSEARDLNRRLARLRAAPAWPQLAQEARANVWETMVFAALAEWTQDRDLLGATNLLSVGVDLDSWMRRGRDLVTASTGSGKTDFFLTLTHTSQDTATLIIIEAKSYDSSRRRVSRRLEPDESARPLPAGTLTPTINGYQLFRAISLFTSVVGLEDWLGQRRTARLPITGAARPPFPERSEPLALACGVRRLAVPLVPRAPGPGFPGTGVAMRDTGGLGTPPGVLRAA
ncbi:hypothetical protein ACFWWB_37880 [Streptomyces sp. NPDC058690]|uniref:hypothetical protein n=1 Tax=Streptomyces sp. NPDC058690 TaxID=3346600 RepID=UPI00364C5F7E